MNETSRLHDEESFLFGSERIPRLAADDPEVLPMMKNKQPIVITGSNLINSAKKWNLQYLKTHAGDSSFHVYTSKNNVFKYFDTSRADSCSKFKPPTSHQSVSFSQFIQVFQDCHAENGKQRVYLQHRLTDAIGKKIKSDYLQFNWPWVTSLQQSLSWGKLTGNLLLIGMEGNVTPIHFDEQENVFAQITGRKRFYLFPPEQFQCFYPYPVSHPCDRQGQVDFYNPDFTRFPNLKKAKGKVAVLEPGDVLYIPMYWWHHVEVVDAVECDSTDELSLPPINVSINFWYKTDPKPEVVVHPISGHQLVSIMRNTEKMLSKALQDTHLVGSLLRTLSEGRFDRDDCQVEE